MRVRMCKLVIGRGCPSSHGDGVPCDRDGRGEGLTCMGLPFAPPLKARIMPIHPAVQPWHQSLSTASFKRRWLAHKINIGEIFFMSPLLSFPFLLHWLLEVHVCSAFQKTMSA